MLSKNQFTLLLMVSVLSVIVSGLVENTACAPNKLILLSNCSFKSPVSLTDPSSSSMTIDNRTLSMTVPHLFEPHEGENPAIQVIRRPASKVPLIRFNLNLIQCSMKQNFTWASVEASSTLRGEFIRTSSIDVNRMYLSLGVTYLRNLTSINCASRTIYRTDPRQVFRVHFQRESTLNDSCSNESLCYPSNVYRCDSERRRCQCRSPLQAYLTDDQSSICIHAVKTIDQCTLKNVRCLRWCDDSSSSKMCLCPEELSTKKYFDEDRAYCESRTNGVCNALLRCPLGDRCVHGTCENLQSKTLQFMSLDIVTISIIVSSVILFVIVIILGISICLLRRQRWKQRSHSSINSVYKKKQQMTPPTTSDYDNVVYGVFRQNVHLSSNDDPISDRSPFTASDTSSSTYNPKIVYLGGEQQLTAIYA